MFCSPNNITDRGERLKRLGLETFLGPLVCSSFNKSRFTSHRLFLPSRNWYFINICTRHLSFLHSVGSHLLKRKHFSSKKRILFSHFGVFYSLILQKFCKSYFQLPTGLNNPSDVRHVCLYLAEPSFVSYAVTRYKPFTP